MKNLLFASKVCITNVLFNEYLYATYGLHDQDRRAVYTWVPSSRSDPPGSCGNDKQGMWRIKDCSSIQKKRDTQELDSKVSLDSDSLKAIRARNKSNGSQILALPDRLGDHLLDGSNQTGVGEFVSQVANTKGNKEKPLQRRRRHHGYLSRKPFAIDSSDQPEVAASSGTRPSSWINVFANVFVDAVKGISRFVYFPLKVELPEIPENGSDHSDTVRNSSNQNTNQFSSEVCVSNNVGLAFFLLQSFLDKKYPLPKLCSATPEEAMASTLNTIGEFEEILRKTAKQSGVLVKDVNFFKVYLDVAGHIRSERYSQIPNALYSATKEACPNNEKFLSILKGNIEKMFNEQQIVNSGYQPNYIADSKPRSYLSNTTVDKHLQRSYHAISS